MTYAITILTALALSLVTLAPARAADDSKVKSATNQVETGAKKIGSGKVGEGVEETAKGIGKSVEEGAKYTGEKMKEAGTAAEAQEKSTGQHLRDAPGKFGRSVKSFFRRLFNN